MHTDTTQGVFQTFPGDNSIMCSWWKFFPGIFKNQRGKKGVRELNRQQTKGSNLQCCLFQLFARQRQKKSNEKDEYLTKKSLLQRELFYAKEFCVFSSSLLDLGAPTKHTTNTRKSESREWHLLGKKPNLEHTR